MIETLDARGYAFLWRLLVATACMLPTPRFAAAQTPVGTEAALAAALQNPTVTSIVLTNNITLNADLPNIGVNNLVVDGGGFTISGNNQFRGLIVAGFDTNSLPTAVNVTIQNLTITNTVAVGGAGGNGASGGGGGAGLGGGLFVGALANVTVSNVNLATSAANGGAGGGAIGSAAGNGGGGGGLGGGGGAANAAGPGGGGGVGGAATGGAGGIPTGGPGLITTGTINDGGGGAGGSVLSGLPGAAGGVSSNNFGGGGGGALSGSPGTTGGLGGGGSGAGNGSTNVGGNGGFGGGGGGSTSGISTSTSLFAGGAGASSTGNGGGGAGLGGAVFVQDTGSLTVNGAFTVVGGAVSGGAAGGAGAASGLAFGSGIFLQGSNTLTFAPAASQTANVAAAITDETGSGGTSGGTASVDMNGAGRLVLSGNNTFSGGLAVNGGTVSVSSDANLGLTGIGISVVNGGGLEITGTGTFSRPMTINGGLETMSVAPGQTASWSGTISESTDSPPGGLHVTGGGTLALTNATNNFTGGTVVTGNSEVVIGADGALGIFGNAPVSLGDNTSGGTLGINAASFSSPRGIVLGAAGGTIDTIGATQATLSGTISGGGLTKAGTGSLILAGANTYSGPTTVSAGVLQAGSSGAFGVSRLLTVGAGATVDFNGFNQTFFSVAGTGNVALNGGATLTLGGDNSSTSLDVFVTGTGSLVKTGSGTLTITGANTFTGGVNLNVGALSISSDANLGSGGALSMAGGTTLDITGGGVYTHNLSVSVGTVLAGSPGQSVTWSGAISGAGGLHWSGTGSLLTLTNASNSYAGGTSIAGGGTLIVTSDGALGAAGTGVALGDATSTATLSVDGTVLISRPITMGALGATIDTPGSAAVTIAGAIGGGGSGGLTKTGAGSLTLDGNDTYTGPTIVQAGRLAIGQAGGLGPNSQLLLDGGATLDLNGFSQAVGSIAGSGNVSLSGGATLAVGGDNSSSTFSGVLSGTGGLVKNGGGLLSLSGANTFAGGTTVNAGTLAGNSASLQGNIVNNALVVFAQDAAGSYGGAMSGSGALAKTGVGALTLGGANTYSGGTLVSAGSIVGTTTSLQGNFVNNGEIVFDQAADGTFQGVISGSGAVTKQGAGLVTLNGANGFSGLTQVLGGTLAIDAGLPGSVVVGANGILRGAGTIGGSLTVDGQLTIPAPGTSAAMFIAGRLGLTGSAVNQAPSLFVNGNLTTAPGSTLALTVSPSGAPPIVVGGAATLQQTNLVVTINDPNPARNATYIALTAAQGLTLSGVTASSPTTGLVPIVKSDSTNLMLTLLNLAQPFQNVATTGNASAAASGLDTIKIGATGDLGTVVQELAALNDPQLDAALKQLSGEILASTLRLSTLDAKSVTDTLRNQLSQAEHDSEDAPKGSVPSLQPWLQLAGDHASFSSANSSGAANVGGGASGVDFKPASNWTVGAGAALSVGGLSLSDVSGTSQLTAPRAFGYSGVGLGSFHLHLGGSVSRSKTTTQRSIQFVALVPNASGQLVPLSTPDGIDRTASSDETQTARDAWTELQDTIKRNGWILDLKIAARAFHLDRSPFTETGANSISLNSVGDTLTTREGTFEGHYYRKTGSWRPNILVSYQREVGNDITQANVNFAGEPASQFTVDGAPVPLNTFHGLFGLTMRTALGLQYTLEYETLQSKGESQNSIHFRMKFR